MFLSRCLDRINYFTCSIFHRDVIICFQRLPEFDIQQNEGGASTRKKSETFLPIPQKSNLHCHLVNYLQRFYHTQISFNTIEELRRPTNCLGEKWSTFFSGSGCFQKKSKKNFRWANLFHAAFAYN